MTLFKSLYQNDCLLRNGVPLKIRLLQCYELLCLPNIEAICIQGIEPTALVVTLRE